MTRQFTILFVFLTFLVSSCAKDIYINNYIDKSAPLELIIYNKDSLSSMAIRNCKIEVNSEKYNKLIQWGNENIEGWHKTYASYKQDIFINQGDFRLLYIKGYGIVIGFTGKDGKAKQYQKTIMKGGLDFFME